MDARRTTACVTVRSASGLSTVYRNPFLKFTYEKPSSGKRISSKSPVGEVIHVSGTNTSLATWSEAIVCVPKEASPLNIELWNAFPQHDIYLGVVDIPLTSNEPTEIGPSWFAVNSASYCGVRYLPINLEVIITYTQSVQSFPTSTTKSSVIDPTFQFKVPSRDIDWSRIAAANIQEIFFMGNVDKLSEFHEDILYGNTLSSLDMVIDKNYEKAFQMCQYSSQYLDSCITLLNQRCSNYLSNRELLLEQYHNLERCRDDNKRTLRQLKKQSTECDSLLRAYEAISNTLPQVPCATQERDNVVPQSFEPKEDILPQPTPQHALSSPTVASTVQAESPPKPPMLMSYEERIEQYRLAKEANRAERIAAEKQRLIEIMAEQTKQREWKEKLKLDDQAILHNNARCIQAWFSHITFQRRYRRKLQINSAVVTLQRLARQRLAKLAYKRRQEERRQELHITSTRDEQQRIQDEIVEEQKKKQEEREMEPVLLLWSDIQIAFQRARRLGANSFEFFDTRQQGQVDRATFRNQLRRIGFDVPRQVVRRLIRLIHSRNGIQTDRLVITSEQFMRAFDLDMIEPQAPAEVAPSNVPEAPVSPDPPASPPPEPIKSHIAPPTLNSVEGICLSFRNLRQSILDAARKRFGGGHSFASLRAALSKLFESFDSEGTGEVPIADFKTCMEETMGITVDYWEWIRECFDADGNGTFNIAEFVAFSFADSTTDEMGVLGYQLRDAILSRVKLARKDATTLEDAVRSVFYPAFERIDEAPFAQYCHVLDQLQLGFTLGQLSRLVLRLDQDKNHLISLDELLRWLKLRTDAPKNTTVPSTISDNSAAVKNLRLQLLKLAGGSSLDAIKTLFERIDRDGSGQVSSAELHKFLAAPNLPLSTVEMAVACMDLSLNGVVSKSEFITFCSDKTASDEEEVGVLVEQCREKILKQKGEEALQEWFDGLGQQGKVRTSELKRCFKALVHLTDRALDAVVRRLDRDSSGWITDKEFRDWLRPVRDIEVLLELVEQNPKLQAATDLISVFDLDGNGAVGIEEFHAGLKRYSIQVTKEEAAALLKEYDVDADGVLSANELRGIVEACNSDDFGSPSASTKYDEDFE
ncbi:hypothetical protein AeMF1_000615 [Aphanomyces euteiches]|nr:hypothetical protein AeMF1_000615 [Aphanomyces euteiches]KAH9196187.1 hypothetical protein AeNC1_001841 [Aphanomyces euteiches]